MEARGASLVVSDLRKSFRLGPDEVEVLRGVTFRMEAGESLAILGPSGCGKSTLLHLIGALDRPTAGRVELDGASPHQLPEPQLAAWRNRAVGFVFQDHHLLPQYDVLENVLLPALAGGGDGAESASRRALELLGRVGLSHRLRHRPAELSGGERQRAAVARALLNSPRLLLCDEPTGSLDGDAAGSVARLLLELHAQERTMLIVVTHSLDFAALLPRRVRLAEGRCSEA